VGYLRDLVSTLQAKSTGWPCRPFVFGLLFGLFELARMLVRFDYVASFIVNANDGVMQGHGVTLAS
jgi:hypothetical protein